MDTAKIFWSGRSQAVRLPKAFRFEGTEVRIRKQGNRVILEEVAPKPKADQWAWLDKLEGSFDDDAVAAALEDLPMQERPELDKLFK